MIMRTDKPRVLVVDDELGILDTLRILLKNEGFEPHTAHGGKQGLEMLAEIAPDVVLTDIRMPNVSGVELLSAARAALSSSTPLTLGMRMSVSTTSGASAASISSPCFPP